MTVEDFVRMAGGYGFRAKKSKAYIVYMNGMVARAKRNSKSVVEPGCEIIVPERRKNKATLGEIMSITTTTASLATMIATIGTLIKENDRTGRNCKTTVHPETARREPIST